MIHPLPVRPVWARYAAEANARGAMESSRFGAGPWSVECRPDLAPFCWCLIFENEWGEWP